MSMSDLDRVAARQLGLVTTAQLRQLGLTQRQIERSVSKGTLVRVRYLVYRLVGSPLSWEQAVLAATLGSRASAVASHETAAALWQLRHCDRRSPGIHVTADRRVDLDGVTSHLARIAPEERTHHLGIPITTPDRTIIDLAETLSARELGECLDDGLRRDLVHLPRLRRLVAEVTSAKRSWRRLGALQEVLADRIPGYRPDDSDFEKRMNAEWARLRLPHCERQYQVRCANKTYRLDVALVDTKIGVEWESLAYHGTRSGIDNDSDRRAALTAEGWVILSFTWNSSPESIARAVFRLWRDRGGEVAPRSGAAVMSWVAPP